MNKERNRELDSLKFIFIFLIFTFHFISDFKPQYLDYLYTTYPIDIITYGITGKLCTAGFGVLLGYFAYNGSKKRSLLEYSIKRYGYFVWVGLFINIIFSFLYNTSLIDSIIASFRVSNEVFPAYWFARPFLFASIIAYFLGKSSSSISTNIIFIVIFFLCNDIWVAICLMGTLVKQLSKTKLFNNVFIRILLIIVSFILIKREESDLTYFIDGIFTLVLIIDIEKSHYIKKILCNKTTSNLGKNTMAILVIHSTIHKIVGGYLFDNFFDCRGFNFILVWIICFIIIVIISYPVTYLFDLYGKLFDKVSEKIHFKLDGAN